MKKELELVDSLQLPGAVDQMEEAILMWLYEVVEWIPLHLEKKKMERDRISILLCSKKAGFYSYTI